MSPRSALPAALLVLVLILPACTRDYDGGGSEGSRGQQGTERTTPPLDPRGFVVSPDGDDEAEGSEAAPWATLAAAFSRLRPGDTLAVRGGRYRERITDVDIRGGTPDAPIVVEAFPGERPVLEGLLWLSDPDHWTISGLGVTWDAESSNDEHMVKLIGGSRWSFTENELWGAKSFAALLIAAGTTGEPAHWRVARNCIHDTVPSNDANQDQLIYANTGLSGGPGVIEGNILYGAPNGMGVKLGGPSEDSGGAANVSVVRNTIAHTAQNLMVAWRSRGNRIERNLLYGTGDGYGNIRGYRLDGEDNVIARNAGGGAAALILDDDGYRGFVDGGGNRFPVEPAFESEACDGFVPAAREARAFGARS